jgi:hypothetical protein
MAANFENNIIFFLRLMQKDSAVLGNIRTWDNLKVAYDGDFVWVSGFDYVQINSLEVKTMPFKTVFYEKNGKLYLYDSILPEQNLPSLLFTPILRAFPVQTPSFNHNFFGLNEKIDLKIQPSDAEKKAVAMLTALDILENYTQTAPAARLKNLQFAQINEDKVFLIGTPILPIQGEMFWQTADFFLPVGFDFDLFALSNTLNEVINPHKTDWIIWLTDSTYFKIEKYDMTALSIAAVRSLA